MHAFLYPSPIVILSKIHASGNAQNNAPQQTIQFIRPTTANDLADFMGLSDKFLKTDAKFVSWGP